MPKERSSIPNVTSIDAWKARRTDEAEQARNLEVEKKIQSYIDSDAKINYNAEDVPANHGPESDHFVIRPEND